MNYLPSSFTRVTKVFWTTLSKSNIVSKTKNCLPAYMVATAGHRVLLTLDNLLCGYSYRSMAWCPSQSMFLYVCQNFSVGLPASVKKQHETGGSHCSDYESYCTLWCFFLFCPSSLYWFSSSPPDHARPICPSPSLSNFSQPVL